MNCRDHLTDLNTWDSLPLNNHRHSSSSLRMHRYNCISNPTNTNIMAYLTKSSNPHSQPKQLKNKERRRKKEHMNSQKGSLIIKTPTSKCVTKRQKLHKAKAKVARELKKRRNNHTQSTGENEEQSYESRGHHAHLKSLENCLVLPLQTFNFHKVDHLI